MTTKLYITDVLIMNMYQKNQLIRHLRPGVNAQLDIGINVNIIMHSPVITLARENDLL